MRLMRAGFVLIALPLVAMSAAAAQTLAPPSAESDLEAVVAEARAWVTKPATDQSRSSGVRRVPENVGSMLDLHGSERCRKFETPGG